MTSFGEALKRANINVASLKDNEKLILERFPIKRLYTDSHFLSDRKMEFDLKYSYRSHVAKEHPKQRGFTPWLYLQGQTKQLLSKYKDNLYILPKEKCRKYFHIWIGHNTIYQRFVLRGNLNIRFDDLPKSMQKNNLMTNIVEKYQISNDNTLFDIICKMAKKQVTQDTLLCALFGSSEFIIPVEDFDPLEDVKNLIHDMTIVIDGPIFGELRDPRVMRSRFEGTRYREMGISKTVLQIYYSNIADELRLPYEDEYWYYLYKDTEDDSKIMIC